MIIVNSTPGYLSSNRVINPEVGVMTDQQLTLKYPKRFGLPPGAAYYTESFYGSTQSRMVGGSIQPNDR